MSNVLFVVAQDYPDMEEVHERLLKGAATEHVTYRRKGDRLLKGIAEVLGVELPEYVSAYDFKDGAYVEECLNHFDFIIVYGTPTSGVTGAFEKKVTTWPYDKIWAHKVDLKVQKPRRKKK